MFPALLLFAILGCREAREPHLFATSNGQVVVTASFLDGSWRTDLGEELSFAHTHAGNTLIFRLLDPHVVSDLPGVRWTAPDATRGRWTGAKGGLAEVECMPAEARGWCEDALRSVDPA